MSISLGKDMHLYLSLWFELGDIHCELKMDKQGLQAGETGKNKAKTKPRYESRKMVLKLQLGSKLE